MSPSNTRRVRIAVNVAVAVILVLALTEILLRLPSLLSSDPALPERDPTRAHILSVGDSFTRTGKNIPDTDTYPGHLQVLLDDAAPGRFRMVNLGTIGVSSTLVANQLSDHLERYRPVAVIAWAGVNIRPDMVETGPFESGAFPSELLLHSEIYRFIDTWLEERRVEAEMKELTRTQAWRKAVLANQEIAKARDQFIETQGGDGIRNLLMRDYRRIVEITRASGAQVIFVTYPFEAPAKSEFANDAMRNVGKDLDIPVISSGEAVMRVPEEKREWRWMAHPGSEINREIARAIAPVILDGAEPGDRALQPEADRARPEKIRENGDS